MADLLSALTADSTGWADVGGAVNDLFGAAGDTSEGNAYGEAASYDKLNAQITQQATGIAETQAQRQLYQVQGGTQAQVGGAGFANSGSSMDILRSSAQQGALQKQLIQAQGQITSNGYEAEAQHYSAMQKAAYSSSTAKGAAGAGNLIGGVLSLGAAVLPFL